MPRTKGHKLLTDSDSDEKDRALAGKTFNVKYLGAVEIPSPSGKGKGCTDQAASQILSQYKNISKLKSLTTLQFFVSANCVSLSNPSAGFVLFRYPTVKLTYCNTVEEHERAFVFVGKDVPSAPFKAHVVLCDSTAKANELFTVMREAFSVRFSMYQAKIIDQAGWTAVQSLSQEKSGEEKLNGHLEDVKTDPQTTGLSRDSREALSANCNSDANNNTNAFGEFVCATPSPQSNGWNERRELCNEKNGMCHSNGWSNGHIKSNAEKDCSSAANKVNHTLNGKGLSLAQMILSRSSNRGRSHSAPSEMPNPLTENVNVETGLMNGQKDYSQGFLHATARENEEDTDGFTQLALERSSSMKPRSESR